MPVRRPKSCESCRIAKARCSLAAPCARCARRDIECIYAPCLPRGYERRKTNGFRIIRPANSGSLVPKITDSTIPTAIETTSFSLDGVIRHTATAASAAVVTADFPLTAELDITHQYDEWPLLFDIPASNYCQSFDNLSCPSFSDPQSLTWLDNLGRPEANTGLILPSPAEMPRMLSGLEIPRPLTSFGPSSLSLRTRSLQQGSLTAKMVYSRLTDYTRMLADGQLPPFIHSPCALGCSDECLPASRHRCLPETLATCANLTQMFHSRMPGSHGFVWQQICTHVQQMRAEYESYDEQRLLHAMQAAVVYGMVCSQCTGTIPSDDAAWIVDTIETFGEMLYDICAWGLNADHLCMTRTEWVLMESLRRIACILYLVDLLFQTNAQSPSSGECPEFHNMPLPCVRELWQPISDREWKKRYQAEKDVSKQKGKRGLTYRDLLMLKRSSAHPNNTASSSDSVDELADWCERADDFSMLLWMALSLEGEGQLK